MHLERCCVKVRDEFHISLNSGTVDVVSAIIILINNIYFIYDMIIISYILLYISYLLAQIYCIKVLYVVL